MPASASIPALKQYLQAAQALGLNCDSLLAEQGISAAQLDDNSQRIELRDFETVVQRLIESSGHPFFGLFASRFITPSTYASLGLMSISASTLGDCIALLPHYESLVGDMGTSELLRQDSGLLLAWHCQLQQPLVRRHCSEAVLASWLRYSRQMLGLAEGELLAVQLQHPRPQGDIDFYQRSFACEVHFNCRYSGLLLPDDALAITLPQANPLLQQSLIEHANQQLQALQGENTWLHHCEAALLDLLPDSDCSKARLASSLSLSPRTLQRRLQQQGSSYQQLLDKCRFERAKILLKQSGNMEWISGQLGFAESRSFLRRFKQWSGITPGQFRRRHN